MNKRLVSIIALLVTLMLVVLTGCEKEVPKTDGESTTATTTKVTETTEPVSNNHISMDRVNSAMLNNNVNAYEDAQGTTTVPGNDNVTNGSGGNVNGGAGNGNTGATVEVQDDEAVIKSGVYHIVAKADMGEGITPMEMAVKGDKIYMNVDSEQGSVAIVITSDVAYIIMHDTKLYLELDKEFLDSQGLNVDDMLADIQYGGDDEVPSAEYKETIDGIVYDVKEYESGRKVYLIGKTMIKSVAEDGSAIYFEDICTDVPDSLFAPPAGYELYE